MSQKNIQVKTGESYSASHRPHRSSKLRSLLVLGAGLTVLTASVTALSEVGTDCEGTEEPLASPLHTFCPGAVARAMDVNANFRTLLATIGTKLDRVGVDPLYIQNEADAELGADGAVVTGRLDGANLTLDGNEILARNNGSSSDLYINASGNDSQTFVQSDGGRVVIGPQAGTPEERLLVRGEVHATGEIQGGCRAGMEPFGAYCIDVAMRENAVQYYQAQADCVDEGAMICPLEVIIACDALQQPAGCNAVADNTNGDFPEHIWTSTILAQNGDTGLHKIASYAGDNIVDTFVDSAVPPNVPAGYFCCSFR